MKKIIMISGLILACITQVNCNSRTQEFPERTLTGGYVRVSTQYSKDFKSHFAGYIFGINKILDRRDKRHKACLYSPINHSQIEKLRKFLDGELYGHGNNTSHIPNSKKFWTEYEKITGREKISWKNACTEMHHIIPRDLNGPIDAWNFIELTKTEHQKITRFITLIKQLDGRTLTKDKEEIRRLIDRYDNETIEDYLEWIDMRHHL